MKTVISLIKSRISEKNVTLSWDSFQVDNKLSCLFVAFVSAVCCISSVLERSSTLLDSNHCFSAVASFLYSSIEFNNRHFSKFFIGNRNIWNCAFVSVMHMYHIFWWPKLGTSRSSLKVITSRSRSVWTGFRCVDPWLNWFLWHTRYWRIEDMVDLVSNLCLGS